MKLRLLTLLLTALFLAACSQLSPVPSPQADTNLNASAVPTFTYVKSLTDGLAGPLGSAVGPDGTVYVVNYDDDTLVSIDATGSATEIASYGSGTGQIDHPYGVAADTTGRVFVAEYYNDRMQVFKNGAFDSVFATDDYYYDVAFDADGTVYAAGYEGVVYKYTSDGTLLDSWDGSDSTLGALSDPYGIDVDDKNVYVTDGSNNAVYVFDKDGATQAVWQQTDGANVLDYPVGVAVSGDYVYVADSDNYQIVVFDKQGDFVTKFGSEGTGNDQFEYLWGIDIVKGQLYASDYDGDVVKLYDLGGQDQADSYTVDLETAPLNKILYSVKVGSGVSYAGSGTAISSTIRVDGYQFKNGKRTGSNQVKVVSVSGDKVLTVVQQGTNTPNPTGGELDIKPSQAFGGPSLGKNGLITLKSLTINGVSTSGAKLILYGNGKPIKTLPLAKTESQTLMLDEPGVGFIQVRANDSFTVDDLVFEVATPN